MKEFKERKTILLILEREREDEWERLQREQELEE